MSEEDYFDLPVRRINLHSKDECILAPGIHISLIDRLEILLPEERPDVLILKTQMQGESDYRYSRISLRKFLAVKEKIIQVLKEK